MTTASATEKSVQINNLRFRYLDWGTEGKPPMVCIHGHTGQAHVWDQFARAFSSDFHVYAIDQRGHGGTQWAADGYDRDRYVEDLAAFIDVLSLDKVAPVGHSMGGWHSMLYTPRHQDKVASIIMVDIAPERSPESAREVAARPATPHQLDSLDDVVAFLRLRNPWAPDVAMRKDAADKTTQRSDGKWVWKADPQLFGTAPLTPELTARYWRSLETITCPILHVRGTESLFVSDQLVQRMKSANPGLRNVDIPGTGHDVHIDKPAELIAAAREFIHMDG